MGLAERRILKDFQDNYLPKLQARVHEAAGFELSLEINWEQLTGNEYSHIWIEDWGNLFFEPLIAALQSITRDEMGQEALQKTLRKVVIQDSGTISYAHQWSKLDGDTLTLDHQFVNVYDVNERTSALIRTLENGL